MSDAAPSNEEKFLAALKRLEADPQPVSVEMAKSSLWLMLSAVQLACRHPAAKTSKTLQAAKSIASSIMRDISANDADLRMLAEMGWEEQFDEVKPSQSSAETGQEA